MVILTVTCSSQRDGLDECCDVSIAIDARPFGFYAAVTAVTPLTSRSASSAVCSQ